MTLVHDLFDIDRAHIDLCGLTHLLQMLDIHVNHEMLIELVEIFHSKHNMFHFPVGEMNITLKDVYKILWIPLAGNKVDYDLA